MKKINLLSAGLSSSVLMGVVTYPLTAIAQFSPVQNAQQSVVIRGDNNTVTQEINQTVIFQPSRGLGGYRNSPSSGGRDRYSQDRDKRDDDKSRKEDKKEYKKDKKEYKKEYKKYGWDDKKGKGYDDDRRGKRKKGRDRDDHDD